MLFRKSDIKEPAQAIANDPKSDPKASSPEILSFDDSNAYFIDNLGDQLDAAIEGLQPGTSIYFVSNGLFSNYHILEKLLDKAGTATVAFTTWSISELALSKIANWMEAGTIQECYAILDIGNRSRKPEVFQRFQGVMKQNYAFKHIHAKVMVIANEHVQYTVIGSANFTKNPRAEVGIISMDPRLAELNINWIKRTINAENNEGI